MMKTWKYYNHAMIPTSAPHEDIDVSSVKSKEFWKTNKKAILARWTSDFDCKEETNWWYVIKDTPWDISQLKSKRRYEINKGRKNFEVRLIDAISYREELYDVTVMAYSSWPEKYRPSIQKSEFISSISRWSAYVVYGAFSIESGDLCGYAYLKEYETYYSFVSLRVIPEMEKMGINSAIIAKILDDFTDKGQFDKYICDGARSISHETSFQEYLEKYFGFRKAFCQLHIQYRPGLRYVISMIYPLRRYFSKLDHIRIIHQINSLLKMESIRRNEEVDN